MLRLQRVATIRSRWPGSTLACAPTTWAWQSSDSVVFQSERDREDVERWLLRGLIKDSEGFMSRYLERRISLAVSRRLAKTRVITPNAMTLVSVGIGIIGAVFFVFPRRRSHVLGALLLWLHSVLDGCDGELARLKFAESRRGGLLDFWGDNVVHSAVFLAIALRSLPDRSRALAVSLAALSVGGTLCSAGFVYWTTMRRKPTEGPLFTSVVDSTLVNLGGSLPPRTGSLTNWRDAISSTWWCLAVSER